MLVKDQSGKYLYDYKSCEFLSSYQTGRTSGGNITQVNVD